MTGVRAETLEPSGFRFWLWASPSCVTLDRVLTALRCSSLIYKVRVVTVPAPHVAQSAGCSPCRCLTRGPPGGHWEDDDKTLGIKVGSTIVSPVAAPARSLSRVQRGLPLPFPLGSQPPRQRGPSGFLMQPEKGLEEAAETCTPLLPDLV